MAEPAHLGPPLPPPTAVAAVGVPRRQIVAWENGAPVVRDVPLLTPATLRQVDEAALATLYSEPDDELAIEMGLPPSEFYGRPLAEVMLIRSRRNAARKGDVYEVEAILDRHLGKPKQTSENKTVHETYAEYLERVAGEERAERARAVGAGAPVADAQFVDPSIEDLL